MTAVSVIIPTHNRAAFLKKAVESVLSQTGQGCEIIVVDDGSEDDTAATVTQFGAAVHYIRQENRGLAVARNTGIRNATGELISFLDDDDLWLPNYLATVVSHFGADPSLAALHTGHQLVDGEEGRDLPGAGSRTVPADELYDTLIESGFFPPSSVTVRRSCLDSVGLFDERLQGYADWELWLRISREHKFVGIPDILIKYRIHVGGMSTDVQHMTEDRLRAIRKHFGPPDGRAVAWPRNKRRAYAFAYRSAAFEYLMQGQPDEGWCAMQQAASIWPEILNRPDTFYELACDGQPKGYRGMAKLLDIERNGAEMLMRLDRLFSEADSQPQSLRRPAYGNAYLALGMLSDQAGRWGLARRYLWQAVKADPQLLRSYRVARRLLKLFLGRSALVIRHSMADDRRKAQAPGR